MAKSKYETHVLPKLDLVEAWARDGLVEKQIAHNLGVAVSTLNLYKKDHPEFSEALARGKEVPRIQRHGQKDLQGQGGGVRPGHRETAAGV